MQLKRLQAECDRLISRDEKLRQDLQKARDDIRHLTKGLESAEYERDNLRETNEELHK